VFFFFFLDLNQTHLRARFINFLKENTIFITF